VTVEVRWTVAGGRWRYSEEGNEKKVETAANNYPR
jgi:hypothetical protein